MTTELEIEFKNMLTVDEFNKLTNFFKITSKMFISQTNYYFDTEDFILKNNNSALRIRKKEDEYELTLKQPAEIGLYETNELITEQQFQQMKQLGTIPAGTVKEKLENYFKNGVQLQFFGELRTERAEVAYNGGLIALDMSTYLNKTDYELEYEVTDVKLGEKYFLHLLDELSIQKRKTDNKIVRFYKEKMRKQ